MDTVEPGEVVPGLKSSAFLQMAGSVGSFWFVVFCLLLFLFFALCDVHWVYLPDSFFFDTCILFLWSFLNSVSYLPTLVQFPRFKT